MAFTADYCSSNEEYKEIEAGEVHELQGQRHNYCVRVNERENETEEEP